MYELRFRARWSLKQFAESNKDLKKAIELDPKNTGLLLVLHNTRIANDDNKPLKTGTLDRYVELRSDGRFKSWREQLDNGDASERMEIILALGHLRPALPGSDVALGQVMTSGSKDEKRMAFDVLKSLGPETAGASHALAGMIEQNNDDAKTAAEILRKLGAEATQAVPVLRKLLYHENRDVRMEAATIIYQIDPQTAPQAARVIAELYTEVNPKTGRLSYKTTAAEKRKAAFRLLRSMGKQGRTAIPTLAKFVIVNAGVDKFSYECEKIMLWLSSFDKESRFAIPAIKHFLESACIRKHKALQYFPISNGRHTQDAINAAVNLTGKLGSAKKLLKPCLANLLRIETDQKTRELIVEVLPELPGELELEFLKTRSNFEIASQQEKICSLVNLRERELSPGILLLLRKGILDKDPAVQAHALTIATMYGARAKVLTKDIVQALNSTESTKVKHAAMRTIGSVCPLEREALDASFRIFMDAEYRSANYSAVKYEAEKNLKASGLAGLHLLPKILRAFRFKNPNYRITDLDKKASLIRRSYPSHHDKRLMSLVKSLTGLDDTSIIRLNLNRGKFDGKQSIKESTYKDLIRYPELCYLIYAQRGTASDIELVRLFHAAAKGSQNFDRRHAARMIGELKNAEALIDLLSHPKAALAVPYGMQVLGKQGLNPLLKFIDSNPEQDVAALNAIRSVEKIFSNQEVDLSGVDLQPVQKVLATGTSERRVAALRALLEFGKRNNTHAKALRDGFRNSDFKVKIYAAQETLFALRKRSTDSDILNKQLDDFAKLISSRISQRKSKYLESESYIARLKESRKLLTKNNHSSRSKQEIEEMAMGRAAGFFGLIDKKDHLSEYSIRTQINKRKLSSNWPPKPEKTKPVPAYKELVIANVDLRKLARHLIGFELDKREEASEDIKKLLANARIEFVKTK